MCMIRHSAIRPFRSPPIHFKHAQNQLCGYDWNIRSFAPAAETLGSNDADAWTREGGANENELIERVGLWRRLCSMIVKIFYEATRVGTRPRPMLWGWKIGHHSESGVSRANRPWGAAT